MKPIQAFITILSVIHGGIATSTITEGLKESSAKPIAAMKRGQFTRINYLFDQ
jgi:hypothetical protein